MADRNRRRKHVERARIVLLTAGGVGTLSIMRQVGCAKATVWRWQERFMAAGVDGLPTRLGAEHDAPGAPHPNGVIEIDHLVVLTPSLERTIEYFDRL